MKFKSYPWTLPLNSVAYMWLGLGHLWRLLSGLCIYHMTCPWTLQICAAITWLVLGCYSFMRPSCELPCTPQLCTAITWLVLGHYSFVAITWLVLGHYSFVYPSRDLSLDTTALCGHHMTCPGTLQLCIAITWLVLGHYSFVWPSHDLSLDITALYSHHMTCLWIIQLCGHHMTYPCTLQLCVTITWLVLGHYSFVWPSSAMTRMIAWQESQHMLQIPHTSEMLHTRLSGVCHMPGKLDDNYGYKVLTDKGPQTHMT